MPPTPKRPKPRPTGVPADRVKTLERMNIKPAVPTIRASDFGLLNSCAFSYYLQRRLGLKSIFHDSDVVSDDEALRHGTWCHKALEYVDRDRPARHRAFSGALAARVAELQKIGESVNLPMESLQRFIDREKDDAFTALSWMEAILPYKVPNTDLRDGLEAYLNRPHMQVLCRETRFVWLMPKHGNTPLVIELDRLLFNHRTHELWIEDYKTCSFPPAFRAQSVQFEFQPLHYLSVLSHLLKEGIVQKEYDLPRDCKVGGITHVIIQKPNIQIGRKDAQHFWYATSKRSSSEGWATVVPKTGGKWKVLVKSLDGTTVLYESKDMLAEDEAVACLHQEVGTKPAKDNSGEPQYSNYTRRCETWYRGEGDYAGDTETRINYPPVVISTSPVSWLLDTARGARYARQLNRILTAATMDPDPQAFDPTTDGFIRYGKLTPYARYYVTPPEQWPQIMAETHMVQSFRDQDLLEGTRSRIIPPR